jgi:hypothetical protein
MSLARQIMELLLAAAFGFTAGYLLAPLFYDN